MSTLERIVPATGSPAGRPRPVFGLPLSRVYFAYLVAGAGLTWAYFAFPKNLFLWPAVGLSAVVVTVIGVRSYHPARPMAWYLLAGAEMSLITGDTIFNVLTDVFGETDPFPSVADAFYLLTYPLLAAGIFLIIRGRGRTRDVGGLVDALIITAGVALLAWMYLIVPNFSAEGVPLPQRVISVAYPLGDVLAMSMLARLLVGGGTRLRSMQLLAAGGAGLLGADICYGLIQLNGTWQVGGPVDLGWAVFYLAWGAAALHPSMRRLGEAAPRRATHIGGGRIAVLAAVGLIAPAVLVTESPGQRAADAGTVAVFSAMLFLLVILRLSGIVRMHEDAVRRERALRSASEKLVVAQQLGDVWQAALGGVTSLTGGDVPALVSVWQDEPTGIRLVASSAPGPDGHRDAGLWTGESSEGYLTSDGTLSVTPLRMDREVTGMLVVRREKPMRLDVHLAFGTLAAQVALAGDRIVMAAALRRGQSEARFRRLIQDASDIIIVVDAEGLVSYVTPSVKRDLGREAEEMVGHGLANLLHHDDVNSALVALSALALRPSGSRSLNDWRLMHADGGFRSFEVRSCNLLSDRNVAGLVLTMRDVSERRALEEQLQHLAFHDGLSGLANRVLFQDRAAHALGRTARLRTFIGMLMIDIDDFKLVNDTRGHAAGDELLIAVARRLEGTARQGVTLARFGGDEFAILVEDLVGDDDALSFATRVMHQFATPFAVHGEQIAVHASAGLVVVGGRAALPDLPDLLRRADLALYAAKERGKDQVVRYHEDLHTKMLDRLTYRSELLRALERGEFALHYQPIVTIDTGAIVGCEALIRWEHPDRGLLAPSEFIDLAEDTGLIVPVGRWVLDQACAQARAWADAGRPRLHMAINMSARQLQEPDFVDEVRSTLRRHGLAPDGVVLELTESLFVLDGPEVRGKLDALKAIGVRIAMDDFGTGYSSLANLQHFPIDILKIDKTFVDHLGADDMDDDLLTHAIVSLAHSLHLEIVAEGIERVEQRDQLHSLGCQLGQGYLYSRPVTGEQMSAMLTAGNHLGPPTLRDPPQLGPGHEPPVLATRFAGHGEAR